MRLSGTRATILLMALLVLATGPCPATVLKSIADLQPAADVPVCCTHACETPEPTPSEPTPCPYCEVMGGRPEVIGADPAPSLPAPSVTGVLAPIEVSPLARPHDVYAFEESRHGPPGVDPVAPVRLLV